MKKKFVLIIIMSAMTVAMSSTAFAANRVLSNGASGDDVYALQQRLAYYGYFNESPTGYFGSITENSLIQFQRDYGLEADGLAGSATCSFLGILTADDSVSDEQYSYASLSRTLSYGMSGDDVYTLQNLLADYGYFSGTATGYFGNITKTAVMNFQSDYGLDVDGIAGPITCSFLETAADNGSPDSDEYSYTSLSRTLSYGMSGDDVYTLQYLLSDYGYFNGTATGYFGELTKTAVMNFQSDYDLDVDGIAGPDTIGMLTGTYSVSSYYEEDYQTAVLDAIDITPATSSGYCAEWVKQVFINAGILTYDLTDLRPSYYSYAVTSGLADSYYSDDTGFNANDFWAYVCCSNDISELQPGMIVATRNSYTYLGRQFGHVGIYIGNGQIVSSVGYLEICSFDEWNAKYNNTEAGSSIYWGYLPY